MSDAEYEEYKENPQSGQQIQSARQLKQNSITPLSDEEVALMDEEADMMKSALWVHL